MSRPSQDEKMHELAARLAEATSGLEIFRGAGDLIEVHRLSQLLPTQLHMHANDDALHDTLNRLNTRISKALAADQQARSTIIDEKEPILAEVALIEGLLTPLLEEQQALHQQLTHLKRAQHQAQAELESLPTPATGIAASLSNLFSRKATGEQAQVLADAEERAADLDRHIAQLQEKIEKIGIDIDAQREKTGTQIHDHQQALIDANSRLHGIEFDIRTATGSTAPIPEGDSTHSSRIGTLLSVQCILIDYPEIMAAAAVSQDKALESKATDTGDYLPPVMGPDGKIYHAEHEAYKSIKAEMEAREAAEKGSRGGGSSSPGR
jgi:chromosome segregation ATPase